MRARPRGCPFHEYSRAFATWYSNHLSINAALHGALYVQKSVEDPLRDVTVGTICLLHGSPLGAIQSTSTCIEPSGKRWLFKHLMIAFPQRSLRT